MNSPFRSLQRRWQSARTFAAAGSGWSDKIALGWAGIARLRPFAGDSLYATLGRAISHEISPRLRDACTKRVHLDLTDLIDLMVFEEVFLENIYPLAEVPFSPEAIVDCGACAGLFTMLAQARFPAARLHLFEPEPNNLIRLRRNLATNHLPAEVHAAAVGVSAGRARFSGQGFGGHLATADTEAAIEVELIDFPRFIRGLGAASLVLKIDIEGAEAELLPAIAPFLPPRTALFLETHQAEPVWEAYLRPLLQAGFTRRVIRRRTAEDNTIEYVEHLLLRNR